MWHGRPQTISHRNFYSSKKKITRVALSIHSQNSECLFKCFTYD
jgi:hypothetical protein